MIYVFCNVYSCIFGIGVMICSLWDLSLPPITLVDLINAMLGLRYEKDMYTKET